VKLPPLDYIRPGTVTEALKVWSDREVMFLAGGQGLLSEMGQGLRRPATLADISAIPELGVIEITADGSMIRAGAAWAARLAPRAPRVAAGRSGPARRRAPYPGACDRGR
jgi:CO/xanthine dehydrogenase FAD-binding subunit